MLVGTKSDLRDDASVDAAAVEVACREAGAAVLEAVTSTATALSALFGSTGRVFVECSSLADYNVELVFQLAARSASLLEGHAPAALAVDDDAGPAAAAAADTGGDPDADPVAAAGAEEEDAAMQMATTTTATEAALTKNCAVVGNGTVGKTTLCVYRATGDFPEEVYGDVFDRFETTVMVGDDGDADGEGEEGGGAAAGGTACNLTVWDTAGSADYGSLVLKNVYPIANVFLVCFAVNAPQSLTAAAST